MTIQELTDQAYQHLVDKGFANQNRGQKEVLQLILSEIGEAQDAHRSGKICTSEKMKAFESEMDTPSPNKIFEKKIKDTFGDELADTLIRIINYAREFSFDFGGNRLRIEDGEELIYDEEIKDIDIGIYMEKLAIPQLEKRDVGNRLFDISYNIARSIENKSKFGYSPVDRLIDAMMGIFELATQENIDLDKHVRYKMDYNMTRPHLHGKKY